MTIENPGRFSGNKDFLMGEKKTPTPFISACEKFKYLEVLAAPTASPTPSDTKTEEPKPAQDGMASVSELIETIKVIVTETSDDDGWAFLGEVGKRLNKRYPDFDTRNYGHAKLTPLISSLKEFEIQSRKSSRPHITLKYIRNK
jgi:Fe-S-cluster formation regulator IscX/YfhJ